MDIEKVEELRKRFHHLDIRHNPDKLLKYPDGLFRKASILIPLYFKDGEWWVILTLRSKNLTHHAGLVAFPGGMADDDDPDEIATALREAEEEIGLMPKDVCVIGVFSPGLVRPNSIVSPVIGVVPADFKPVINEKEVSLVFHLPLKRFLSKDRMFVDDFVSPTGTYHNYHFEDNVDGQTVDTWGFSACYCIMTAIVVYDSDEKFCFYRDIIVDKNGIFKNEGSKVLIETIMQTKSYI